MDNLKKSPNEKDKKLFRINLGYKRSHWFELRLSPQNHILLAYNQDPGNMDIGITYFYYR